MKMSDRKLLAKADIVICSYMPDDRELAADRALMHFKQLDILHKRFKSQRIVTVASNYSMGITYPDDRDVIFVRKRLYKAEIHNLVIRQLRKSITAKSVLILGDDVVPTKMDGIKRNPFSELKKWLEFPGKMPAPLMFFSCKGTLRDTYYKTRMEKGVRFSPTAAVTDWAIMVRNDLDIFMEKDEIFRQDHDDPDDPNDGFQYNSDAVLRFKAADNDYEVLKDQELFFETFQSTSSDKNSVWYESREQRRDGVAITSSFVRSRWPWLFSRNKDGNISWDTPVWMVRGKARKKLVDLGFLTEMKYGCVPDSVTLRKHYERKQIATNSLVDLL